MVMPGPSKPRLRARRNRRPPGIPVEMDSGGLDIGGAEICLHGDGGDIVGSTSLPDLALALNRYKLGAGDLPRPGEDDEPEEVTPERS